MRKAFLKIITDLAAKDKDVYLVTGDLGFHVFEDFAKRFPGQFVNAGVAEQSMMGLAAGLAMSGKKPYVYSIVPFATLRCLEQIRNDVCYQNLDVKIMGVGGGFSYGTLGSTHSVMEDLAILRTLPNMTVLAPSDLLVTEELVKQSYATKTPTYIRMSNIGDHKVYEDAEDIKIGKPYVACDGKDGVVIATGMAVSFAKNLIEELEKQKISLKLLDMHTLKPIDKEALLKETSGFKNIFTIEEHGMIGGLGSAVAEILIQNGFSGNFRMIGMKDEFSKVIGSARYLQEKYIFNKEVVSKIIKDNIK